MTRVPVYKWALPADTRPLQGALEEIIAGRVHAVLFTSPRQADHLLQVAAAAGQERRLRQALRGVVVGVVGPSTRAALERHGLSVDLEPERPRMGHLVHTLVERLGPLLSARGRG